MRYTSDEEGRLNNFAVEPKMYQATPPSAKEQRNYIILGAITLALVSGLVVIAVSVS